MRALRNCAILVLILLTAACSKHSGPVESATAESRLTAIYPVIGPLINPKMSKQEFVQGVISDNTRQHDQELEVRVCETIAAAWARFSAIHHPTAKQHFLAADTIWGQPAPGELEYLCNTQEPKGLECLSTNDIAELFQYIAEEGNKRGLKRDDPQLLVWK